MKKYQMTVTVPISAEDDPLARSIVQGIMESFGFNPDNLKPRSNCSVKLQEVFDDKPPRKVSL